MNKKQYNKNKYFGMFTKSGNKWVVKKVNKLYRKGISPDGFYDYDFMEKHFGKRTINLRHGEVHDTSVRYRIASALGVVEIK